VTASTATHSQSLNDFIAPLRVKPRPGVAAARSGYRNVYLARRDDCGANVWVAKVKVGGKLRTLPDSRSTNVRETAICVARWYRERFGVNWARLARSNARRRNPWKVWYSERYGGWLARVWIKGKPVELRRLTRCVSRRRKPDILPRPWVRPVLLVFPTAKAAKAAIWPWVERQYRCEMRYVVYLGATA
jgi:hypothetical protein